MTMVLFADPHLGLTRTGNTTPRSRQLLRESVSNIVSSILSEDPSGTDFICLGDLFDTYSNPEQVIREGMQVVRRTALTLTGNHDMIADADKVGSLELIRAQYPDKVVYAEFGKPGASLTEHNGVLVGAVPHVTTQDIFDQSLVGAYNLAADRQDRENKLTLLCLHCNFDPPWEMTETSLVLSPAQVEKLLEVYDYIFLGHEHQPRDLYDGRLVILGNTHPTGFSDISSKRIAIFDDDYNLAFKEVWNAKTGYAEYTSDALPDTTEAQFVRINGTVGSDELAAVSKAVAGLWRTSPQLLALRSDVKVTGIEQSVDDLSSSTAETLPALIKRELKSDPAMQEMWEEFTTPT